MAGNGRGNGHGAPPPEPPPGQPPRRSDTLFNAEIASTVLGLIRQGVTWNRAAETTAVSSRTLRSWRERGQEEAHRIAEGFPSTALEAPYLDFYVALPRAEAEAEASLILHIQGRARGGTEKRRTVTTTSEGAVTKRTEVVEAYAPEWQAAAWLLERRFPDRWRRRDSLDVTTDAGSSVSVTIAEVVIAVVDDPSLGLSDEQRLQAKALVAARFRALAALDDVSGG